MSDRRTCLVTGTTHGIGRAVAFELARKGFRVVMGVRALGPARTVAQAITHETGNEDIHILPIDLSDPVAVRIAAAQFVTRFEQLHLLVDNAGIMSAKRELTTLGVERMFATNHLGPYLLTRLLVDRLRQCAPSRIVVVASAAHARGRLDLEDLACRRGFSPMVAYGTSKLANVLFTRTLARRLHGTGVTVNCLHPGVVATNIVPENSPILRRLFPFAKPFMRSPERAAEVVVKLALDPALDGVSGAYFDARGRARKPAPAAQDDALGDALWSTSARLTGIPA